MSQETVIITQAEEDIPHFKAVLQSKGLGVYEFPTIRFEAKDRAKLGTIVKKANYYDLLIFTSRHSVQFFNQTFPEKEWKLIPVAAVGDSTAELLTSNGFQVIAIPQEFTSAKLSEALESKFSNLKGKCALIPHSQLTDDSLEKQLKAIGADVISFVLYETQFIEDHDKQLENMLMNADGNQGVQGFILTFTSPSTITGFTKRIKPTTLAHIKGSIEVVCIGPTTVEAARKLGFTNVHIAEPHTLEGIATLLGRRA